MIRFEGNTEVNHVLVQKKNQESSLLYNLESTSIILNGKVDTGYISIFGVTLCSYQFQAENGREREQWLHQ